jgi:hypothetical protein
MKYGSIPAKILLPRGVLSDEHPAMVLIGPSVACVHNCILSRHKTSDAIRVIYQSVNCVIEVVQIRHKLNSRRRIPSEDNKAQV